MPDNWSAAPCLSAGATSVWVAWMAGRVLKPMPERMASRRRSPHASRGVSGLRGEPAGSRVWAVMTQEPRRGRIPQRHRGRRAKYLR